MREFTDIEIQLCKKIAEKEKKEIIEGDWVAVGFQGNYTIELIIGSTPPRADEHDNRKLLRASNCIPLWQEHDCLGWLREKGWKLFCLTQKRNGRFNILIKKGLKIIDKPGNTMLECWQSAVLAVMEGK